jgi:hypothetical protein
VGYELSPISRQIVHHDRRVEFFAGHLPDAIATSILVAAISWLMSAAAIRPCRSQWLQT